MLADTGSADLNQCQKNSSGTGSFQSFKIRPQYSIVQYSTVQYSTV